MDVAQIVSGALALVGLIATGISMILASSLKTLRDGLSDLRQRVTDLEAEREVLKGRLTTEQAEHETTKKDLETLRRVVTGEAYLVAIEQLVKEHHDEALQAWSKITALMDQLVRRVERMGT